MKRILLFLLTASFFITANAQNNVVLSAYNYLRSGRLDKAKEQIDISSQNDQSKITAKNWFYRGNIYLSIYLSQEEKYHNLDPNALQEAYDAYNKAIEIDAEIINENLAPASPVIGLYVVGEQFYNQGVEAYNGQNYNDAFEKFGMTRKINSSFGYKDTIATFNMALCALQLQDNAKSKELFEDLAKNNYHNYMVYKTLANIYKVENDTIKAVSVIQKGRKLMPDDLNLLIEETNVYLQTGKTKEAQQLLDLAVSKDPDNATLHYAIGVNMAEVGEFDRAESAYKKAIELQPDYFDAFYNLGALYVNTSVSIIDQANALEIGDPNYDVMKTKADALLNQAIPVLEKAHELQPTDLTTLYSLKQIYARINDEGKLKSVNDKINNLK